MSAETSAGASEEDAPLQSQAVVGERNGVAQWLSYGLVRLSVGFLARLPRPLTHHLLTPLAIIARRFDKRHAEPAREFLQAALGPDLPRDRQEALVLGAFRHLAMVAIDSVRRERSKHPVSERYELQADPEVMAAIRKGGPAVIITGHIGDWEAATQWVASAGFRPLFVVAKPPKNRPLSIWMQRRREHEDVHLLSRYGAIEGARKAVQQGGSIGFLLDHRATSKPVLAPFFGRPALCERSSSVLLRRLRVPAFILACYQTKEPLRYRVHISRHLPPEELKGMGPEAVTSLINAELEKLILAAPEQYHWLHNRYRGVAKALRRQAEKEQRAAAGVEEPAT